MNREETAGLGLGGLVALVMGSSGLFFLPTLGIPGATVLSHALPEWDLALGAGIHALDRPELPADL